MSAPDLEGAAAVVDVANDVVAGAARLLASRGSIDDHQVLALTRSHGKGALSGAEVESGRFAQLAEFEDGLAVRVRLFGDERRALAAAGKL